MRLFLFAPAFGFVAVTIVACADVPPVAPEPPASPSFAVTGGVPSRAEESPRNSVNLTDERLWQLLDGGKVRAWVGLRAPGRARGIWRGERLISRAEEDAARHVISAMSGITLVREVGVLPIIEVQIRDQETLARLRRSPHVDYVEPATIPAQIRDEAARSHGAQSAFQSACLDPEPYSDVLTHTASGDVHGFSYGRSHHRITDAWSRTQGDNIRIALLDTGMDPLQAQFTDPAQFSPAPWAYTRLIDGAIGSSASDPCSHGTRMAGLLAAPMDGRSVTGIAWKSDLRVISVASRHILV